MFTSTKRNRRSFAAGHSAAILVQRTIWRCTLFPPASSQSQFKVREGFFKMSDFMADTPVAEPTHLYETCLFGGNAWEGVCLPSSSRNSARLRVVGFFHDPCDPKVLLITLPKTNSLPLKSQLPNSKVIYQPPFFRDYVKLRGCILSFGPA